MSRKLATTLQTYVEAVADAEQTLQVIALEVSTTASALRQLQDLVEADALATQESRTPVLNANGTREIESLGRKCKTVYQAIVHLLVKSNGSDVEDHPTSYTSIADLETLKTKTRFGKLKWPWVKKDQQAPGGVKVAQDEDCIPLTARAACSHDKHQDADLLDEAIQRTDELERRHNDLTTMYMKLLHQFHNEESEKRNLQAKYDKVIADLGDNEATMREKRHIITAPRQKIEHCKQDMDGSKSIPAGVAAWRHLKHRWKRPTLRTSAVDTTRDRMRVGSCLYPDRYHHRPEYGSSTPPPPPITEFMAPGNTELINSFEVPENFGSTGSEIEIEIPSDEPVLVRRFSEFVSTASDDDEDADGSEPGIESDSVTTRKEFRTGGDGTATQAEPPAEDEDGETDTLGLGRELDTADMDIHEMLRKYTNAFAATENSCISQQHD
ncbi:uncharacterized protein PG986_011848 [Apiospora aurea]|uniref:Fungal N-terminal domain-containing protein n=1 Tax=Apiospora aurea TaxID=335848 RepID=A0ABR1PYC0_9PEZI